MPAGPNFHRRARSARVAIHGSNCERQFAHDQLADHRDRSRISSMNAVIFRPPLWIKFAASTLLILVAVWPIAFIAIDRDYSESISAAEQRVENKSQIFAQYSVSNIRRIDQIVRESRLALEHDQANFANFIEQQLAVVHDVAFQIAVIDKNGVLVFSSIDPSVNRVDLSDREHFRVHHESQDADRLFISRPLVGKNSGKWSIQFTRPIFKDNRFDGVLVVSVDPEQFGVFGQDLSLGTDGVASLVRHTGERMARFPIDAKLYGQILPETLAYLAPNAPKSGSFSFVAVADEVERIFGFTRLPEYGVIVVVGESKARALATHVTYTLLVLSVGLVLTLFTLTVAVFIFRRITEKQLEEDARRVAASVYNNSSEAMMLTNSENIIFGVNPAFTALTGFEPDEVVGKSPHALTSGDQGQEFWREFWQVLNTTGQWRGEVRNRRKDGTIAIDSLRIDTVHLAHEPKPIRITAFRDVTTEKASQEKMWQLANYDALTGLANRRSFLQTFEQELKRAERTGAIVALIFLDIDHFKNINDTFGHSVGDALLTTVASRLRKALRQVDTIARMGGDEFTIILSELSDVHDIEDICQKILDELAAPTNVADHTIYVTASLGIAIYPDDCVEGEALLKSADQAMYEAKAAGRNMLRFFDAQVQAAVLAEAALEADLRTALERGEFRLHYQIQFDDASKPIGAEALVRWEHPQRGLLAPGAFIGAAEKTGLIVPIGAWVLEAACVQLAVWATQPEMQQLTLAVNVSANQFRQPDFVDRCLEIFARTGVEPNRLKFEPTESLLHKDVLDVVAKMTSLRAQGVRFALDDFGTGYSSLTYLRRLPLDQLKIDQSFVRDIPGEPNACVIVRTIIVLGQSLGLAVIAEGVETEEQRKFLADSGCRLYQGYLFGRPVPIDVFEAAVNLNHDGFEFESAQ